ncbi:MAG: hypothetical protein J6Y07_00395 [Alphaproteobacteria bacterium]|nr:hypothetical protein [Alphaproteobacteria bacterium]
MGKNLNDSFEQDVKESLQLLYSVLDKKSKRVDPQNYAICRQYVVFLKSVANNPRMYCKPGKEFDKNTEKLSFFVRSDYPLVNVDERAAQSVYDIMICMRDYIIHYTESDNSKYECKYKSKQEAINAMRLFKRDSIEMTGGMIPYVARNLMQKLRDSMLCHKK